MIDPRRARRGHRLLSGLALGCVIVLALPLVAAAHSDLETAVPEDRATVTSPFQGPIELTFSARLAAGSKANLVGPDDAVVAAATVDRADATMTFTLSSALAPGAYRVQWTSIAVDGDLLRGTVRFTVAPAPTPSPSATPSPTPSPTPEPTPSHSPSSEPTVSLSPSVSPSVEASPPAGDGTDTAGGGDVVLPIVVALVIVGAGAVYLLSRRNRSTPPG